MMNDPMKKMAAGVLGGLIATLPMTLVMISLKRVLPPGERYALPPRQITHRLAEKAGKEEVVDQEPESTLLTGTGHFGYGAAAGGLYGLLFARAPIPLGLKGIAFGMIVWAASYLGWLPALEILPPATQQPERRNLLMIASHWVYGIGTAWITHQLIGKEQ